MLGVALNAANAGVVAGPVIVMAVALHEELAPVVLAVEFGVPLPMMVIPIPLGTVIPDVHVQDPAGMLIVSPLTALCVGPLMTAFTAD
jgi:hypothetical protein